MVIAKILALLRSHFNLRELFSMHIDYSNRDESKEEAAFVRDWAERHGFTHFERVISEVKRGVTDRAEYEKISRNLRYGFYKEILTTQMGWVDQEEGGVERTVTGGEGGGHPGLECGLGVIFGHHAGDVQENVLSNIMRGCSPLNLAGMHEVGITEGVPVWRPLLKHVKDEIFDFAHRLPSPSSPLLIPPPLPRYGIPYFRDTTPTWSTRGKLRRQLVPLLIDMYGTGCLRNISSLAAQSDEAMTLVSQNIYDPFMRSPLLLSPPLPSLCSHHEWNGSQDSPALSLWVGVQCSSLSPPATLLLEGNVEEFDALDVDEHDPREGGAQLPQEDSTRHSLLPLH
jgi:hypothetical protein